MFCIKKVVIVSREETILQVLKYLLIWFNNSFRKISSIYNNFVLVYTGLIW